MTSEAIAELETALTIRQHNKPGLERDINRSATHQTLIRLYRQLGVRDEIRSRSSKQASSNVLFLFWLLAVRAWALFWTIVFTNSFFRITNLSREIEGIDNYLVFHKHKQNKYAYTV